jgi:prefoldin subunit 5
MVNPSKANALNRRANSAIKDLARWSDYLKAELGKQSPLEQPIGVSKYSEESYQETIELKRKDIEMLADSLRHIRRELDKFTLPG